MRSAKREIAYIFISYEKNNLSGERGALTTFDIYNSLIVLKEILVLTKTVAINRVNIFY